MAELQELAAGKMPVEDAKAAIARVPAALAGRADS